MKMKTLVSIWLIVFIHVLISVEYCTAQKSSTILSKDTFIIKLSDNEKALINPDMGWNMIYYTYDDIPTVKDNQMSNLNSMLNEIPCGIVSNRVSWKKMEPKEGQYNWELLDVVIRPLVATGKRVAFKWYTNFLWDNAERQATPLWVKDAGAKGHYLDMDGNHSNDTWIAEYGDSILLEKLGNFYKAAAEHYRTFPVEFIELGSIGRVGEGTSWEIAIVPTYEEMIKHIDLLRAAFPNTQLIINDDHEAPACLYAKSVGYGVDDHSIGVGGKSGNPNNTGRPYNKEIINHFQDGTTIIGLENETWFQIDNWYLKQMIDAKANFCRIHQSPFNLKADSIQPILKQMNLKMGYRIQFPEIKVPSKITKGKPLTINFSLKNEGVGYCLKPYYPVFTIIDENNKEVASSNVNSSFKTSDLKDGVTLNNEVSITIPTCTNGKVLSLYIAMCDKDRVPVLNLPYDNNDGKKRYFICQLGK
jgi:hypothetical protein